MSYVLSKHTNYILKGWTLYPEQRLTQYNHRLLGIGCHYTVTRQKLDYNSRVAQERKYRLDNFMARVTQSELLC